MSNFWTSRDRFTSPSVFLFIAFSSLFATVFCRFPSLLCSFRSIPPSPHPLRQMGTGLFCPIFRHFNPVPICPKLLTPPFHSIILFSHKGEKIMPRQPRSKLETTYFHIIVQGIGKESIFKSGALKAEYLNDF